MAGQIAREIVNDPVAARELAGEQGSPVGRAQGHCVERIDEQGAFRGKAVHVGGFEIRMAAGMELVEAQIVYQHHDDVRTLAARSAGWRRFRRVPASGDDEDESRGPDVLVGTNVCTLFTPPG